MHFGLWDTLFNLLAFLFWFRIWNEHDRNIAFNPYLSTISRAADSVCGFLRSALGLPERVIALAALVVLLFLRGLAVPPRAEWIVVLGIGRTCGESTGACLLFSVLSFCAFIFKIWVVSLIYVRSHDAPSDRAESTLYYLSRPLTNAPYPYRPLIIVALGMAVAALMGAFGQMPVQPPPQVFTVPFWTPGNNSPVLLVLRSLILALVGGTQTLLLLSQFMIFLIIGSWISMFMSSRNMMLFCREWMNLLLGPLQRYPLRIGMLDLSPLVFFFAIMLIHGILTAVLSRSYFILL